MSITPPGLPPNPTFYHPAATKNGRTLRKRGSIYLFNAASYGCASWKCHSEVTPLIQSSTTLDYKADGRPRRRRWPYVLVGAVAVCVCATQYMRANGIGVVCFTYDRFTDDSATLCPDRIVSQSGTSITLADGRAFRVDKIDENFGKWLEATQPRVFVDTSNGTVYYLEPYGFCGNSFHDFNCNALFHFPLRPIDRPTVGRREFAKLAAPWRP